MTTHNDSWGENESKNILFDFWRDYSNASMSEDRDDVIERYSARLATYIHQAEQRGEERLTDALNEVRGLITKYGAKLPDSEAIAIYDGIKRLTPPPTSSNN